MGSNRSRVDGLKSFFLIVFLTWGMSGHCAIAQELDWSRTESSSTNVEALKRAYIVVGQYDSPLYMTDEDEEVKTTIRGLLSLILGSETEGVFGSSADRYGIRLERKRSEFELLSIDEESVSELYNQLEASQRSQAEKEAIWEAKYPTFVEEMTLTQEQAGFLAFKALLQLAGSYWGCLIETQDGELVSVGGIIGASSTPSGLVGTTVVRDDKRAFIRHLCLATLSKTDTRVSFYWGDEDGKTFAISNQNDTVSFVDWDGTTYLLPESCKVYALSTLILCDKEFLREAPIFSTGDPYPAKEMLRFARGEGVGKVIIPIEDDHLPWVLEFNCANGLLEATATTLDGLRLAEIDHTKEVMTAVAGVMLTLDLLERAGKPTDLAGRELNLTEASALFAGRQDGIVEIRHSDWDNDEIKAKWVFQEGKMWLEEPGESIREPVPRTIINQVARMHENLVLMSGDFERQNHLSLCKSNLKNIGTALEMYATDHERYPAALEALTPDYLAEIPECLAHGEETYSTSYYPFRSDFFVYCGGVNHNEPNLPAYSSTQGLHEVVESVPEKFRELINQ